jgi:hypothetical protein
MPHTPARMDCSITETGNHAGVQSPHATDLAETRPPAQARGRCGRSTTGSAVFADRYDLWGCSLHVFYLQRHGMDVPWTWRDRLRHARWRWDRMRWYTSRDRPRDSRKVLFWVRLTLGICADVGATWNTIQHAHACSGETVM